MCSTHNINNKLCHHRYYNFTVLHESLQTNSLKCDQTKGKIMKKRQIDRQTDRQIVDIDVRLEKSESSLKFRKIMFKVLRYFFELE